MNHIAGSDYSTMQVRCALGAILYWTKVCSASACNIEWTDETGETGETNSYFLRWKKNLNEFTLVSIRICYGHLQTYWARILYLSIT